VSYIIETWGRRPKTEAAATVEPQAERKAEPEAEAANGARTPRRRRGRGGRGRRAGVPAAPGSLPEAGASGAEEGDEDTEDEGEDGAIADERGPAGTSRPPRQGAAWRSGRPSLFSWLKRDGEGKKGD
jgi:hypothetical protein